MKTLYLVRHAKSSWENPALGDAERPLNPRGLRDAPFMARLFRAKEQRPDLLMSSPARRAIGTAGFFAEALGIAEGDIVQNPDIYDAYPEDILDIVHSLDDALHTVVLFGHNPTFTNLANLFGGEPIANVPTCGILRFDADTAHWAGFEQNARRAAFHYPKQYL